MVTRQASEGWDVQERGFWCYVRPRDHAIGVQGWKLHLSATPLSAPIVLARSAEILLRHNVPFKFAATLKDVATITSPRCERSAGGKFITAYPAIPDGALPDLAAELHEATAGLPGPGIMSDRRYCDGSLVHYRFGAFGGIQILGNDGSPTAMLMAPDGSLVLDQRQAWFEVPRWAPSDPFAQRTATTSSHGSSAVAEVLLGGRYTVDAVVRHAFKGGVFRGMDRQTGSAVIIKQARPYVGAWVTGHDVRDALRNEAAVLEALAPSSVTPRALELFEQQGDLFLAQELISGVTLREWGYEHLEFAADDQCGFKPTDALRLAHELVGLMQVAHTNDLVIQDFNPNNIMVADDGGLRLIDLEYAATPGRPALCAFTPGYSAPEQVRGFTSAPAQSVDLYALGATLFHLVTGADPMVPLDQKSAVRRRSGVEEHLTKLAVSNETASLLTPLIVELMNQDPGCRPSLPEVIARLDGLRSAKPLPLLVLPMTRPDEEKENESLLADSTEHLLNTMDLNENQHLWPPAVPDHGSGLTSTDPLNVQHGASGVLGALTAAYHADETAKLHAGLGDAARWVVARLHREPRILPGLHFGRSGTAWALLEAGLALGDEVCTATACDLALRVPVSWPNPDICHGLAGAGLTQIRFWELTGREEFRDRVRSIADYLATTANHDDDRVLWPIPTDFASNLAGMTHYGFAHGLAGIGAFLLAAGRTTEDESYLALATKAADTLVAVARRRDGAAYWSSGPDYPADLAHWCSGSSGIATFLVRMGSELAQEHLIDLSAEAALAIRRIRWRAGLPQCHGLAGDAELLLDLFETTGDERYRRWAFDAAEVIRLHRIDRDRRGVLLDVNGTLLDYGFGTGLAGIVSFLLRLRSGGRRMWLPDALAIH
ncbi:class III lanthionine synthetase LanKC [Kribbella albertanoniae]|nr:class IV lanthionine synthetase LanL [Kribbella albertanoniae]